MVWSLEKAKDPYFRWFDNGDVRNMAHLLKIVDICKRTPWCFHFMPTKQYKLIRKYCETRRFPENLNVRVSLPFVNNFMDGSWLWKIPDTTVNAVVSDGSETCRAHDRGNVCGECRMCWDRKVQLVTYRKH
jgi:hypothetical protein